jgi:hypothetical protein
MENFRAVKILLLLIAASAILLYAPGALAYNNVGSHPTINQMAFDTFVSQYMPADQYLKSASLNGGMADGIAWDPQDGGAWHWRNTEPERAKTIEQWLISGGFSADEPEIDMALKHFYDPVRTPHYLTDWINDFPGGEGYVNPYEDAYTWAFADNSNPYGFGNGEMYYQLALADTDPNTVNYGKAWRSVGETMHLIADMTVPAHVRNDAHVPYMGYWDPYEYFTDASDVDMYSSLYGASSSLSYHAAYTTDSDIRTLFKSEATWTNQHFFSRDTVPVYGSTTTANGESLYPSPAVTWTPDFEGYLTTTVDGRTLNLTRQSLAGLIWKTPYLVVDQIVCNDQRSILIPTAIKSSAAVLDAFLPRFKVAVDSVTPDPENEGCYYVAAHIQHIATREWPDDLTIRNGAYVLIGSYAIPVTADNNAAEYDSMNKINVSVEIPAGSTIQVYYDLGGYVIKSPSYTLKQASPTPTPTATPKATPTAAPGPTSAPSSTLEQPWLDGSYYESGPARYDDSHIYQDYWYSIENGGSDSYEVTYYYDPNVISGVHHLYHVGDVYREWIKDYDTNGNLIGYQVVGPDGSWQYVVGTPAPVGSNPAAYE